MAATGPYSLAIARALLGVAGIPLPPDAEQRAFGLRLTSKGVTLAPDLLTYMTRWRLEEDGRVEMELLTLDAELPLRLLPAINERCRFEVDGRIPKQPAQDWMGIVGVRLRDMSTDFFAGDIERMTLTGQLLDVRARPDMATAWRETFTGISSNELVVVFGRAEVGRGDYTTVTVTDTATNEWVPSTATPEPLRGTRFTSSERPSLPRAAKPAPPARVAPLPTQRRVVLR